MKKLVKLIPVMMAVIMALSVLSPVFATGPSDYSGTATSAFDSIGNKIIGMVQAIGTIVSVLIIIVLGIKYMMGSAEEKAEYKKTMLPYLIGAILIFAASTLATMVYNFAISLS